MADRSPIEWTDALFGAPLPRRCRACEVTKPIDAYNIDRSRPDGHAYVCRDCERISSLDVPNRIERAAARKSGRAWCRACGAWKPLVDVLRSGLCRTHQRAADRARYAGDDAHRNARKAHSIRRKRGVEIVPQVAAEALTELFEGRCAYCPAPATTWDHVVPVVKGGRTTPDNILPCCTICNSSKRDRDLLPWLEATGRELSLAALERLSHFQVLHG